MAAESAKVVPVCEQCGGASGTPVPLGPDEASVHWYCVECIGNRIAAVTGWRVQKMFRQFTVAREYGRAMQRALETDC